MYSVSFIFGQMKTLEYFLNLCCLFYFTSTLTGREQQRLQPEGGHIAEDALKRAAGVAGLRKNKLTNVLL